MKLLRLVVVAVLFSGTPLHGQERVVFEGIPLRKVESNVDTTASLVLSAEDGFRYQVRVMQRGERFYWASREMRELIRSESGSYITYHAVDGSGYIKVGADFMLDLLDKLPLEERRREIGYMEHLTLGFASVTYFGNRRGSQ